MIRYAVWTKPYSGVWQLWHVLTDPFEATRLARGAEHMGHASYIRGALDLEGIVA